MIEASHAEGKPMSVGLLGNAAEVLPEMVRRGIRPDLLTDQTSAHDPVNGYLPIGWTLDEWFSKRESDPAAVTRAAKASMCCAAMTAMTSFTAARTQTCCQVDSAEITSMAARAPMLLVVRSITAKPSRVAWSASRAACAAWAALRATSWAVALISWEAVATWST